MVTSRKRRADPADLETRVCKREPSQESTVNANLDRIPYLSHRAAHGSEDQRTQDDTIWERSAAYALAQEGSPVQLDGSEARHAQALACYVYGTSKYAGAVEELISLAIRRNGATGPSGAANVLAYIRAASEVVGEHRGDAEQAFTDMLSGCQESFASW